MSLYNIENSFYRILDRWRQKVLLQKSFKYETDFGIQECEKRLNTLSGIRYYRGSQINASWVVKSSRVDSNLTHFVYFSMIGVENRFGLHLPIAKANGSIEKSPVSSKTVVQGKVKLEGLPFLMMIIMQLGCILYFISFISKYNAINIFTLSILLSCILVPIPFWWGLLYDRKEILHSMKEILDQ